MNDAPAPVSTPLSPVVRPYSRKRKILMILGIVVSSLPTALVVLAFPVGNRFVESNWRAFRENWEARGEIFDLRALADTPVPDADNFAKAPLIAELYRRPADHSHHHHGADSDTPPEGPPALTSLALFDAGLLRVPQPKPALNYQSGQPVSLSLYLASPSAGGPRAEAGRILEAFAPHLDTVAGLMQAGEKPEAYFPLDAERPYATPLAHLPLLIKAMHSLRVLNLALVDAGEEEAARAADWTAGTLRVIRHGTDCPGLASFTIRTLALESAGLEPVWQALHRRAFTDAQWEAIAAELEAFTFGPRLLQSLRFERAALIRQVESGFDAVRSRPFSVPPAWIQLADLQEYGELTQRFWFTGPGGERVLQDRPRVDQLEALEAMIAGRPTSSQTLVLATGILPVAEFARHAERIEISRDQALVAIALERYRLGKGRFPDSLSELEPQWIEALPANADTGHPPRFDLLPGGEGYRLRNLGGDGAEGDPVWVMPPPPAAPVKVVEPS